MPSCATFWIRLSVSVCLSWVLVAAPAVCAAADDPPTIESHDADVASARAPAHPGTGAAEADHARPIALRWLYVSFAGLQALDIDSTMRARARGGREINPIVGTALASTPMLVGTKASALLAGHAARPPPIRG